jgi:hypothetical protein
MPWDATKYGHTQHNSRKHCPTRPASCWFQREVLRIVQRIWKCNSPFLLFPKSREYSFSATGEQRIIFLSGEQPYKQHLIAIPLWLTLAGESASYLSVWVCQGRGTVERVFQVGSSLWWTLRQAPTPARARHWSVCADNSTPSARRASQIQNTAIWKSFFAWK